MKQFITMSQWLSLSVAERKQLMEIFGITPSAQMEVVDDKIFRDGVTDKDLVRLNIGSMLEYLGTAKSDMCDSLFEEVKLKKFGSEEQPDEQPKEQPKEQSIDKSGLSQEDKELIKKI